MLVILAGGLYLEHAVPFERALGPQIGDPTISYPHTPPAAVLVPLPLLFALAAFAPSAGVALLALLRGGAGARASLLGLWLSLASTFFFVNTVKLSVGRLRPDFLARCAPVLRAGSAPPSYACTGDPRAVTEGRKSFPSGHAALSSAGLVYLAIVLAYHLASSPCARRCGVVWRAAAVAAVWMCPLIVGLTRVADYWHHWSDVAVGLVIGHAAAIGSWLLVHPGARRQQPAPSEQSRAAVYWRTLADCADDEDDEHQLLRPDGGA
jgi:membrane-associated phospholipid phosphatase